MEAKGSLKLLQVILTESLLCIPGFNGNLPSSLGDISLKTKCQSHSDARGSQGFEPIHKVDVEPFLRISEKFDLPGC